MNPYNELEASPELAVSTMTTALQELPDHSLDDLERALVDEKFRRSFFSEHPGGMLEFFGLTSPGEAIGGLGLVATWASIAVACAFWPDEAMAQEGAIGAYQSWPTEWLTTTAAVCGFAFVAWRIIEAVRVSRMIYAQYADASDDDLNELYDNEEPADELSEFEGSDADEFERHTRHWVVAAGMLVANMDREMLAGLFPTAFPYPEF